MAWKQDERTEIEGGTGTCTKCGGELIIVAWAFDPRAQDDSPAAKRKRTQAKAKLEKAAPAIAKAHNPDGTRDWSRLSGEELDEARDAIETAVEASAPKQHSPKAWRSKQSPEDMSVLDMEF